MYFIGIFIFLALLIGAGSFSSSITSYIDFPSIVLIIGFTIPIMMASGLLSDFLKGFKLMGQNENPYTSIELKRMLIANKLGISLILISAIMGTIMGGIAILTNVSDMSMLGPSFAVAILTTFYALVLTVVLLPIQAKIKAILSTLE